MEPTDRAITMSYLQRQLLLRRTRLSVPAAVRRLVGLQAQYSPSPHLALAARLDGFRSEQLHRALERGSVVKATLMRGTLHLVAADRFPHVAGALQDAGLRYWRRTWQGPGVDEATLAVDLRSFLAEPRTSEAVSAAVEKLTAGRLAGRGTLHTVKALVPTVHMPPSGFWRVHGAASLRAWPQPLPPTLEATTVLVRDYLAAYGPATRADIGGFAALPLSQVDAALAALEPLRRFADVDGRELYDLRGLPAADPDLQPPPRLLPKWDSALLSHEDRRRILPAHLRGRVISRANGDVVATYLLDGLVAGEWRVQRDGPVATITLLPFEPGRAHGGAELEEEAIRTARFVEPEAERVEVVGQN